LRGEIKTKEIKVIIPKSGSVRERVRRFREKNKLILLGNFKDI
jgi:hypothetical protein